MKASMHIGKGRASHNDRTFDLNKAEHIDQTRQDENTYHICAKDERLKQMSFKEWEKTFYEKMFRKSLEAMNERYIKQRHPERVKTMADWIKDSPPDEFILQVGDREIHAPAEQLREAWEQFKKEINSIYPQIRFLDYAIHNDESTPHIHARVVYIAHDKDGNEIPKMNQCLKEMGIPLPKPEQKEGRFNNRKITLTNDMRKRFIQCVERVMEIELDKVPRLNQQHLDTLQYKKNQIALNIEALEQEQQLINAQYEEQKAELTAKLRSHERLIAEKESGLKIREEQIFGRELDVMELETLEKKAVWLPEDKRNVLKTALMSAENKQNSDDTEKLQQKINSLQTELKHAPSEQDIKALQEERKKLKQDISDLKRDISVRDQFIKEHGLRLEFKSFCEKIGHTLKVKIDEFIQTLRM